MSKNNEAWMGTAASMLVLFTAMMEAMASLLIAVLILTSYAVYQVAHSKIKWPLRTILYILLGGAISLLTLGAVRDIMVIGIQKWWDVMVVIVAVVLVGMTIVWERERK